jgi:hypothetical protein
MEDAMAHYRLYTSDGSTDGHFLDVEQIDAPDDDIAMEKAALNQGEFLELWQEGRKVEAFEVNRSKAKLEELLAAVHL